MDPVDHPALAGDLIWAADTIAHEIGRTVRQTNYMPNVEAIPEFVGEENPKKVYYWLSRGMLPARKLAGTEAHLKLSNEVRFLKIEMSLRRRGRGKL